MVAARRGGLTGQRATRCASSLSSPTSSATSGRRLTCGGFAIGDKVVILRGPREGRLLVFRVDSFDMLLQKAGIADDEHTAMAAEHKPTR